MSPVLVVDEGSGAHITVADVQRPILELKPLSKERREAERRQAQLAQRDKVAAFHADRLARAAFTDERGYDARKELMALARFGDLATCDVIDGRTFNEIRALCAAWVLCEYDLRPSAIDARQVRDVLHRGLVPRFKVTAGGLVPAFARKAGGS